VASCSCLSQGKTRCNSCSCGKANSVKLRGLVKQHIESFNFLIEKELAKIVAANEKVMTTTIVTINRNMDICILTLNKGDL